jgi:Protein of unknown function (DUF2630)
MTDPQIHSHIEELVAEEHALLGQGDRHKMTEKDRKRLEAIEVQLDQYWDLLRQRRARENAGQDPEATELRDPKIVERYQQ